MGQKEILLPCHTALTIRVAMLEHENAQLVARLMAMEQDTRHAASILAALAEADIVLPVPLQQCAFDAERGCLTYEEVPEYSSTVET